MMYLRALLLACMAILSSPSTFRGVFPMNEGRSRNIAFDYLLFSQQWTEGYCRATGHCIPDKVRDYWTIHGLWPTNATSWPENCDPSHHFDPTAIANLRSELDSYWPSVTSENPDGFWSHEWSKHGTCAKGIPRLSGEYNYFSYTMTLYSRWNLTGYLEDARILPDNDNAYKIADIQAAVDKRLEAKADIACERVHSMEFPVLTEIHFCLTKSLEVMDCPTKEQNCGTSSIFYIKRA